MLHHCNGHIGQLFSLLVGDLGFSLSKTFPHLSSYKVAPLISGEEQISPMTKTVAEQLSPDSEHPPSGAEARSFLREHPYPVGQYKRAS